MSEYPNASLTEACVHLVLGLISILIMFGGFSLVPMPFFIRVIVEGFLYLLLGMLFLDTVINIITKGILNQPVQRDDCRKANVETN